MGNLVLRPALRGQQMQALLRPLGVQVRQYVLIATMGAQLEHTLGERSTASLDVRPGAQRRGRILLAYGGWQDRVFSRAADPRSTDRARKVGADRRHNSSRFESGRRTSGSVSRDLPPPVGRHLDIDSWAHQAEALRC